VPYGVTLNLFDECMREGPNLLLVPASPQVALNAGVSRVTLCMTLVTAPQKIALAGCTRGFADK
jgi:hypothetical protein